MARIAKWAAALAVVGAMLAPTGATAQEVFEMADLSEAPSFKSPQDAQRAIANSYPRTLQEAGIGGTVQVRFVVGSDGRVRTDTVEIIATSSKQLGDAAATAISGIEFNPGKRMGSAVAAVVVMPIRYQT